MKVIAQRNIIRRHLQSSVKCALVVSLMIFFTQGCSSQAPEFKPDPGIEVGHSSKTAAFYSLETDNQSIGDATIFFEGIFPINGNKEQRLQIGLRIHNGRATPVEVDVGDTEIKIHTVDGNLLYEKAKSFSGSTTISQHETKQSGF